MKRQGRPTSRKSNKSTRKECQQKLSDLQSLMKSIKDIQSRVKHYPIYLQLSRNVCPVTPTSKLKVHSKRKHQSKSRRSCKKIQSKSYTCNSKANNLRQTSLQTLRKPQPSERCRSVMLNNQSKTFKISTDKHFSIGRESKGTVGQESSKHKDSYYALNQPEIVRQYVSLQLENLKLQRQNLQLQKQLIQKSLIMEKREKQILKNKLKRMKTQQAHQLSNPRQIKIQQVLQLSNPRQTKPAYNPALSITSFDICPIGVEVSNQQKQPVSQSNTCSAVHAQSKISQIRRISEDADSLLLSEDTENQPHLSSEECKETTIQRNFWEIINGWQRKQKKQVRSALGDIANHMKITYSK